MNKISNIYNYIIFSGINNLPISYFLLFQCHQSRKGYIYLESVSLGLCFTWFTSFFSENPLLSIPSFVVSPVPTSPKCPNHFNCCCPVLFSPHHILVLSHLVIPFMFIKNCYFLRLQFAVQTLCWNPALTSLCYNQEMPFYTKSFVHNKL